MFRGFRAILYKEFIVMFRDRATLFFMFFPPLIQIIAFGFALDTDVRHVPMAVLDQDRTSESRRLVQQFVNTQTFREAGEVGSVEELSAEVRRGHAKVGLQIPPGYSRDLRAGRTTRVQVVVDGSDSTVALQALQSSLQVGFLRSASILMQEAGRKELPVEIRPQVLYNPDMRSPNFFVPGVIGIALQISTVFATAMAIVRERERGTMEQLLVSPMSRGGLMLGKMLPYLVVAMSMTVGLLLILRWVFFVPIQGSVAMLLIASFLYVFALLSIGLLFSTRAENQMQALQMTITLMLPSIFFSGFIFPRDTLPLVFYAISMFLPATYFIELMRAIVLRGASFADFWPGIAVLAVMGAVLFSLCALRFKTRVA